jgi:hypothetical protein
MASRTRRRGDTTLQRLGDHDTGLEVDVENYVVQCGEIERSGGRPDDIDIIRAREEYVGQCAERRSRRGLHAQPDKLMDVELAIRQGRKLSLLREEQRPAQGFRGRSVLDPIETQRRGCPGDTGVEERIALVADKELASSDQPLWKVRVEANSHRPL